MLYNGALSISHKATFSILKTIRQLLLQKLPRLPLGTVVDTASGKLKQIIVDQVDSMETTLAHLFPEMTANITAPVLTLIYSLSSTGGWRCCRWRCSPSPSFS